jgi:site-specific recombinase XerD
MLLYQDKIISLLTAYLLQEGASHKTIKNYRSDVEDFLHWFQAFTATTDSHPANLKEFFNFITQPLIDQYKKHLVTQQKSESTISRRMSSLRALLRSAEESGLKDASQINNTDTMTTINKQEWKELEHFRLALKSQGVPEDVIQKKSAFIEDFLHWFHDRQSN